MAADKHKRGGKDAEPRSTISSRRPFLYLFSVIILVIVIVAFVGAPLVTQTARGGSQRIVFGNYRGEEIAFAPGNYFARQYQQVAQQAQEQQDQDTDPQTQMREIWRQAFNQTLFHTAIMYEAEQSDIVVSESRVDREIAQQPQFQEGGRFSAERYRNTSGEERFNLREFLREQLIQQRYVEDKLQNLKTGEPETDFIKAMGDPERRFRFVAFSYDEFPREAAVSFARENEELFRRVDLSVITVGEGRSQAERIREQIAERENTFEEMARAHSADKHAENGGDMGTRYYYELERDFEDPEGLEEVFEASEGTLSSVLETENGWVIYRVNEAAQPLDSESGSDIERVIEYLQDYERDRLEEYMNEEAEAFASEARDSGFEGAAEDRDASVRNTGFFPINYGNVPVFTRVNAEGSDALAEAAFSEDFFRTAFALEEDQVSQPVALRNAVVVLELAEERESSEDTVAFLDSYYPNLVQQYQSEELQRVLLDPQYYEDNFARAFSRIVRGNS